MRLYSILQTTYFAALLAVVMSNGAATIVAHEFEDGHIERSATLIVDDDKVTVEYGIGCSENTMRELIEFWNAEHPDELNTDQPGQDVPQEVEASDFEKPDAVLPESESTPLEFEAALRNEFAAAALRGLSARISATGNSIPISITSIEATPSSRHHVDIVVRMEFELVPETADSSLDSVDQEETEQVILAFEDNNFSDYFGAVRYAVKARRGVFLKESNVAPVLARAERIELIELNAEEIKSATTVNSVIGFVSR